MHRISFVKKLITCILAGLVIGASAFRISITYFRTWGTIRGFSIIPFLTVLAAVVYALIWQARKTNNPSTLAFWQGLIRYGVAFDLAEFGWAKIFHRQLVMPMSKLDLPYNSFSPSDLFWIFFQSLLPVWVHHSCTADSRSHAAAISQNKTRGCIYIVASACQHPADGYFLPDRLQCCCPCIHL